MASSRLVLPWAFLPVSTTTRRGRSMSRRVKFRKLVSERCLICIGSVPGRLPAVDGSDFLFFRQLLFRLPDFCGAVGEEHTVQVVDLVLEDARQPALGLDFYGLAAPVQAVGLDL